MEFPRWAEGKPGRVTRGPLTRSLAKLSCPQHRARETAGRVGAAGWRVFLPPTSVSAETAERGLCAEAGPAVAKKDPSARFCCKHDTPQLFHREEPSPVKRQVGKEIIRIMQQGGYNIIPNAINPDYGRSPGLQGLQLEPVALFVPGSSAGLPLHKAEGGPGCSQV